MADPNQSPELDPNLPPANVVDPLLVPPVDPANVDPNPESKISLAEFQALKKTNERLLEESQKHKAQRKQTEEKLLEAEGKKDELIQKQRDELKDLRDEKMRNKIREAVSKEASKRGCPNWGHLLMVGDVSHIKVDDESEVVKGVENFFDFHEKEQEYSIYFPKRDKEQPNTLTPLVTDAPDWKKDPLGYLKMVRKEKPAEYASEVSRLQREGIVG